MKSYTFFRIIKLGFTNFWRNWWLSLVATLIMTLTLLIISVFVIFNIVINTTTESIKEKIDLAIYFKQDVTQEQVYTVQKRIEVRNDVVSTHFVTKEEALSRWQQMNISQNIKDQITNNDNILPFSLDVKTQKPEDLDSVATYISNGEFAPLVDRISYKENKDIIDKLINITKFSKKIGYILGGIFTIISILVIFNTVKLTIYTRTREIEIMRLVGANTVFIRIPFIIEAILYALFASILSLLLIWIGLHFVSPMANRYLGDISLDLEGYFTSNIGWIFLYEFIGSAIVSIICSIAAMGKHLKI